MTSELVPNVDIHDNLLGVVERSKAYTDGLVHRGVHAFIQNEKGQFLIQRRSAQKTSWPDHYDLSLAETVRPDESYDAALQRGLQEELGITSSKVSLIKPKYYQEYFWKAYKIFGIIYLFSLFSNEVPKFVDGEVSSSQWLSADQITELITTTPELCTPWLLADWQYFNEQK